MTSIAEAMFPREYAQENGNLEGAQVKGDSMTGAGIRNGAILCFKLQAHAEDGQIVVADVPVAGGVGRVVKRYGEIDGHKYLYSEHPDYKPIPADDAEIIGVVMRWINWG